MVGGSGWLETSTSVAHVLKQMQMETWCLHEGTGGAAGQQSDEILNFKGIGIATTIGFSDDYTHCSADQPDAY